MKGLIGTSTKTYGQLLPHNAKLAKLVKLSSEAKKRLKWIDYYLTCQNVRRTCRHYDITPSLFYKWWGHYRILGLRGLESQSRKPHTVRQREIDPVIQQKIASLRRSNPAWSKYKIAHILKRDEGIVISPSSINRIFHDKGLFWPKHYSKQQTAAKRNWKIKRIRTPKGLKGAYPGSVIEIDVKVLTTLGRTFYQFTAIDTCTRMKFIRVYSAKSANRGQAFIQAVLTFYPFPVRHIQSDNGSEFLAECHAFLVEKQITHYFSRARTPKDNPFIEATIKADSYEFWLWGNVGTSVAELNERADYWTRKFNTYRPHQALGYMTPVEYYEAHYKQ